MAVYFHSQQENYQLFNDKSDANDWQNLIAGKWRKKRKVEKNLRRKIKENHDIVQECLTRNNNNTELPQSNYVWVKTYFLKSNIWFVNTAKQFCLIRH